MHMLKGFLAVVSFKTAFRTLYSTGCQLTKKSLCRGKLVLWERPGDFVLREVVHSAARR